MLKPSRHPKLALVAQTTSAYPRPAAVFFGVSGLKRGGRVVPIRESLGGDL